MTSLSLLQCVIENRLYTVCKKFDRQRERNEIVVITIIIRKVIFICNVCTSISKKKTAK